MSKYNFHRNFAVIIGINNYQNKIPKLKTAVPDALKLAEIIQKQHENLKPQYRSQNRYEVQLFLNQRASLSQLNQLITDFKQGQITLDDEKVRVTEDDRLLFYFAGHGIALDALENQDGPVGYLIPQDAISGDSTTYLPMQELHDALNALDCRHMLAILDCCFAGAFRWASLKREIEPRVKVYKERYDRFISDRAWQVITSAADDQKALDSLGLRGTVTEGNEVHSPFAKALFDALLGKGADLNQDGIITATELYSYLRDRVEIFTEKHYQRQTPSLCPLRKHEKGEFIFLSPEFDRDKLEDAPPLNVKNNPYKGLQSYDEKDSNLFFGRAEQIEKLYQKVVANKQKLTLVLGASGTGKSSVVKAGLIPQFRKDKTWSILPPFRPGESPFQSLNNVLESVKQPLLPTSSATPSRLLTLAEESLANWFNNNPQAKLLVVIDQFEELITLCKSDKEREQFQQLIKNSLAKYHNNIHVVITLRLDFEAQFQTSILEDLWNDDTRFVVPPMSQNEFREVIEKPALEKVVYFEPPSLVDDLINEVVQMPGALPLLSFTLSELYLKYLEQRRDNRALTQEDYEKLGRVVGSLTKRANQEYEKLFAEDSAYKDTVRRVMLRMISLQGVELARRQVPKSELVYPGKEENKRVQTVIQRFSDARLIVEGSNSQGKSYVEPAHDALVLGWDKLLEWKKEEEENLILQRRLTPAAVEWKHEQKVRFLWNANPRLDLLKKVLNSNDNWLNKVEAEFVRRSVGRKSFNTRRNWGIAIAVILGLSGLAFTAWWQWQRSEHRRINAELREKSARVLNLLPVQPINGLVVAIEAIGQNLEELPEEILGSVQSSLLSAIQISKERNVLRGHQMAVTSIVISQNENIIVSGSVDRTLRIWDQQGYPISLPFENHKAPINSIDISEDGQTIVSGSRDGEIILQNRTGKLISPPFYHDSMVSSIVISNDGQLIVSGGWDNKLKLWNRQGKLVANPFEHESAVTSVAISKDKNTIVSGTFDGKVHLWDRGGKPISSPFEQHKASVWSVIISDDGKIIGSSGDTGKIFLWNRKGELITNAIEEDIVSTRSIAIDTKKQILVSGGYDQLIRLRDLKGNLIIPLFRGHQHYINSLDIDHQREIIASGSSDTTIRLWDNQHDFISSPFVAHNEGDNNSIGVNSVDISNDGQTIVSGGRDNKVKLWNRTGNLIAPPFEGHRYWVTSVALSGNEQVIVSGSRDKTIRLWNKKGKSLIEPLVQNESITSVAIDYYGKTIVSGSLDGTVKLWDEKGNLIIPPLKGHKESYGNLLVKISKDGQTIASASFNNIINIWNRKGDSIIPSFTPHEGIITAFDISDDGQTIVTGYSDGTVILWNIKGERISQPLYHQASITSINISKNASYIVSTSADGQMRLWDSQGNQLGESIQGAIFSTVAFSQDEETIVTGSYDGTLQLWRAGNWSSWLSTACNRLIDHPIFVRQIASAKSAIVTCQNHVWNNVEKAKFLVNQGFSLAMDNKTYEANAKLKQAKKLNPNLNLAELQTKAQKLANFSSNKE